MLTVNLDKYPNIPINKIIYIISNVLSGLYAVLGVTVIGGIICFKLEQKNKMKESI